MNTIAQRVRHLRAKWGMTQAMLAEATGIDRDKIAKIETGDRQIQPAEIGTLARTLRISAEALIAPAPQTHYRLTPGKTSSGEAMAWFDRCIDNSLFVRRVSRPRQVTRSEG